MLCYDGAIIRVSRWRWAREPPRLPVPVTTQNKKDTRAAQGVTYLYVFCIAYTTRREPGSLSVHFLAPLPRVVVDVTSYLPRDWHSIA